MQIIIKNINEMKKLAESIAKDATFGNTFLLSGDLGSGKTTFTQFFAKELGVKDIVTSPTYNIVKVYDIPGGEFIHMDAYRLGESGDSGEFDDYIYDDDRIMVIEWPEYLSDLPEAKNIKISTSGKDRIVEIW